MDVEHIVNWHVNRANEMKRKRKVESMSAEMREEYEFHVEAAKMVALLSPNYRSACIARAEIHHKEQAVKSLERIAKALIGEARDLAQMFRPVPDALLKSASAPKTVNELGEVVFEEEPDDDFE